MSITPDFNKCAEHSAQDEEQTPRQQDEEELDCVDAALSDSFPASDPPSWTMGVAEPTTNSGC